MTSLAKHCKSTVIPGMRYRDALAAIEWLVQVLGFEKKAVFMDAHNHVAHSELTFGNGMIMIGSIEDPIPSGKTIAQPDAVTDRNATSVNLLVTDADAACAQAKAAGAAIVMDIQDMEYGGRAFTCRDPEGHLWWIGTYDPWAT